MIETIRLDSIAEVFNGKTPSLSEQRISGHPVLKIRDVTDDGYFLGKFESFVDEELAEKISQKLIQVGDILILNAAHNADYVGSKVYRADEKVTGSLATGEWLIIRALPQKIDKKFLYYWVVSGQTKHKIRNLVKGIHLYPKDVAKLDIPLPPLPEQRRIAAILDKADAIRRKRRQAIQLTEEFLRSAFLEMVGPGAKDYETWEVKSIESLAAPHKGSMRTGPFGSDLHHSEFVDDGIAVLGIDNAVRNRFAWDERRFITSEKYEKLKRYTVFPGDVIVTIMGTTGRSAVVPDDIPLAITTKHLATLTFNRDLAEPEFISQAFHHPAILNQIGISHRGAIMNGLNLGLIKSLELPIPPISAQSNFTRLVKRTRESEACLEKALKQANNLFNSLIQHAFRGGLTPSVAKELLQETAVS